MEKAPSTSLNSYSITELLDTSESLLGKLINQVNSIEKLNDLVLTELDPELVPHCKVGCYDAGVLTLFTDNAAWATRLRYSVPSILSKLRAHPEWAGLRSLQVKVQTMQHQIKTTPTTPELSPPLQISATNAAQFQSLADALKGKPGMEKLIGSLERLAKHALPK